MKIVSNDYISNVPGNPMPSQGGTSIFAAHFSAYVAANGHEWIGVMDKRTDSDLSKTTIKKTHVEGHVQLYTCLSSRARLQEVTAAKKKKDVAEIYAAEIACLRTFLRKQQPDVVFLNGFYIFPWLLFRAAIAEGIPTVVQHAGMWHKELQASKHRFSPAGFKMLVDLEQEAVQFATRQIFLNEYSRRAFIAHVGAIPAGQSAIIPLPYKEGAFALPKRKKRLVETDVRLGCVARWDRIKNHAAILQLAKTAQAEKRPWTFESITNIPDTPIQAALKRSYRKHITVHVPMDHAKLLDFYQQQDLMLLPSHFETFGGVVVEAALAGTPTLISPNVGIVDEYRACGLSDLVIDFSDSKKVIRRIQKILRTPPALTAFQRSIKQNHKPEKVFQAYIKLFRQIST